MSEFLWRKVNITDSVNGVPVHRVAFEFNDDFSLIHFGSSEIVKTGRVLLSGLCLRLWLNIDMYVRVALLTF